MNPSHDYRRREIATRDLLYRALRKWRLILVASLLAAIACAAFTLIKKSGGEEELTSEERTAYEKELDAYRRDLEVYPSVIGDSNALLANTRSYLSESLLTKLDPSHVGKAAAVVTLIPSSGIAASSASAVMGMQASAMHTERMNAAIRLSFSFIYIISISSDCFSGHLCYHLLKKQKTPSNIQWRFLIYWLKEKK